MSSFYRQPDPFAPRRRPVAPSVLARAPRGILLMGLAVSVVLHALAVVYLFGQPLGFVDPELMREPDSPLRVRRATYDQIAAGGPTRDAAETPDLKDVSQALLSDAQAPTLASDAPEVDVPDPAEAAPEMEPLDAEDPGGFELPDAVLADVSRAEVEDLSYRPGSGEGEAGSAGGGSGGAGDGAGEAQRLLSQAGFAGLEGAGSAGGGPLSPGLPPIEEQPVLDQRLMQGPAAAPEMDLASDALADTTRLKVPEHLDKDFGYYVSRYDPEGERGYFQVDVIAQRSLRKLPAMKKDVVFLVDTSSSVPQDWVDEVRAGVEHSLQSLNRGDRFNIVLFNERAATFSPEGNVPATQVNIDAARQFLNQAESRGWTDVNAAVSRLLVRDVSSDRVYDLVLISDGKPTRGVMDTRDLINLITQDNDLAASIYCVGIGEDPNRELLEFLAYRNKGFCVFAGRRDDVATTIRGLLSRLRYPLIKGARLQVAGAGVSEVFPHILPDIHQGQRLSLYGRYPQPGEFTMNITGRNGSEPVDFTFTRNLALASRGDEQVARRWGFWKLHHLYSEIIRLGEEPMLIEAIRELQRRYNLRTLY
ncbi:MAG: VWA domain-containing protein [Phycisphaeraceae bacterium]